jgi:hypothetical protein
MSDSGPRSTGRKYPTITTLSLESGNVIEWLLLLFSISKFLDLVLDPQTQYQVFSFVFLVSTSKCWVSALNLATATSLYILFNSLLANHFIIWHYISPNCAIESIFKYTRKTSTITQASLNTINPLTLSTVLIFFSVDNAVQYSCTILLEFDLQPNATQYPKVIRVIDKTDIMRTAETPVTPRLATGHTPNLILSTCHLVKIIPQRKTQKLCC